MCKQNIGPVGIKNQVMPNFYQTLEDFTAYPNQIICNYQDIYKLKLGNYVRHLSKTTISKYTPYPQFIDVDNILYIYQNCQSAKIKNELEHIWGMEDYNNIQLVDFTQKKYSNIAKFAILI